MKDLRLAAGVGFLALVSGAALAAPWLGLRDPRAQLDGLVLQARRPGTAVDAIRLRDGSLRYAEAIEALPGGAIRYRRGQRWHEVPREALAERWRERHRFWLGTDAYGRDLLSRLIYGARVSLAVGFLATVLAALAGGAVGLLSGAVGGLVDGLLMRFADLLLSIPRLFLLLLLVALYRPSLTTTVLVLGATGWMAAARLVRAQALVLRERDFVQAARAAGAPLWRVALVHLLPGVLAPLAAEATLRVGHTMLLEASLSFLGLGVPPPTASWGAMIAEGRDRLFDAWWIATLPGLAIAGTVIALSLVGDALTDRLERAGREA